MADFSLAMNTMQTVGGAADVAKPNGLASGSGQQAKIDKAEFKNALQSLSQETIGRATAAQIGALKFSNHAVERMQSRGIRFSPEQMSKIESAVQKAAAKGSKDTLLLTENSALIVSVKDKTVVTVMDKAAMKENVFTNIDSTVMI